MNVFINIDPETAFKKIDDNNSGNMTLDEYCNYVIKWLDYITIGDCIIEIMKKKRYVKPLPLKSEIIKIVKRNS